MRQGWTFFWIVSLFFFCTSTSQVRGETKEAGPTVSLDVTEANLEDVFKLLSKQTGMNFVASEEARGKTVTMYLEKVPAKVAVQTILEANRLVAKPVPGTNLFLVAESKTPEVETITKVIRLKHARVITSMGEQTGTLSFQTVTGATTRVPTGATTGGATGGAVPIGGTPTGGGGGFPGGAPGGLGQPTAAGAGGIVATVRSLLSEHGTLSVDPRINALIITDIPEQFPKIEKVIAELDVKQPQVYIQAEVLEVKLDTLRRMGVEYGDSETGQIATFVGPKRETFFPFTEGLFDTKTQTTTLGTISFTDVNVLFQFLATESDVKFLARPKLLALSNETATIQIVSNAATSETTTSQATTGTITTSFDRTLVGTTLRVTPIVHGDRYITMVIQPEVSRVEQSSKFTNALDPASRSALTTVTVQDGQMIMIAGLISRDYTDATRKLPGLGDLPALLGAPFRRTQIEDKNTEIIVFLTPRIVKEEEVTVPQVQRPLEREQTPLSTREQQWLLGSHRRELYRRSLSHTVRILGK